VEYFTVAYNFPAFDDSYIHDLIKYPGLDPCKIGISLEEIFNEKY